MISVAPTLLGTIRTTIRQILQTKIVIDAEFLTRLTSGPLGPWSLRHLRTRARAHFGSAFPIAIHAAKGIAQGRQTLQRMIPFWCQS